jgi:hypothetical protein
MVPLTTLEHIYFEPLTTWLEGLRYGHNQETYVRFVIGANLELVF